MILDYLGESNVITRILIRRRQESQSQRRRYEGRISQRETDTQMQKETETDRHTDVERDRDRQTYTQVDFKDATLLALKMEREAMTQKMRQPLEAGKIKGTDCPQSLHNDSSCQHPSPSPVRLLISRTVREISVVLSRGICDNLLQQPQEADISTREVWDVSPEPSR